MHVRLLIGCVLVLCSFAGTSAQSANPSPVDSAVRLEVQIPGGTGWGSGVVVNQEGNRTYVLTNAHNFRGFRRGVDTCIVYPPKHPPIQIDNIHYMGDLNNGEDIALISGISENAPPPIDLLDRDLGPGDAVHLVGYPLGKQISIRAANVTDRIMSDGRERVESFDQPVQTGMSGGPVYVSGRLAGLIYATEDNEPFSLAVRIGPIRRMMARVFPRMANRWQNRTRLTGCPGGICDSTRIVQPQIVQPNQIPGMVYPQSVPQQYPPARAPPPMAPPAQYHPQPNPPTIVQATEPVYNGLPIEGPDLSKYVERDELKEYARRGDLKSYVTDDQVDGRLSGYAKSSQLDRFAAREELNEYAKTEQVNTVISSLRERLHDRIESRVETVVGGAASKLTWLNAAKQIAEYFGLSIAIPGGVFGLVAFKIFSLWIRNRVKPAGGPAHPFDPGDRPDPNGDRQTIKAGRAYVNEAPRQESEYPRVAPETVTRTKHEIVRVPTTNKEAEALHEALSREAKSFPQHAPIVERLRSVAKQLMHGGDVSDAGRGETEQKKFGVGWKD